MKVELSYDQTSVILDGLNALIGKIENSPHYSNLSPDTQYKIRTDGKRRIEGVKSIILDVRSEWRQNGRN